MIYLSTTRFIREDKNNTSNTSDNTPHDDVSSQIEDKNQTYFIDKGIYTRNQLFRTIGPVKYDKPSSAVLRIASTNQFKFITFMNHASQEVIQRGCQEVVLLEKQGENVTHDAKGRFQSLSFCSMNILILFLLIFLLLIS